MNPAWLPLVGSPVDLPAVPPERGIDRSPVSEIVNGAPEPGFPAVVTLGVAPLSVCTGTLVTPRLVLTAAHCSGELPLELVVEFGRAGFGPSVDQIELAIPLVEAVIHPDYRPLVSGETLGEFDVAIAVLAEPVSIDPIPFRTLPLPPDLQGETIVSVGFGLDESGNQGAKRSTPLTISSIDEMFVRSATEDNPGGANICSGDSGGPQLLRRADGTWEQIAIHSWADVGCDALSGSTRTDVASVWILDQVERIHGTRDLCEAAGRYDDGRCDLCVGIDPDCLGEPTASLVRGEVSAGCVTKGGASPTLGWLRH